MNQRWSNVIYNCILVSYWSATLARRTAVFYSKKNFSNFIVVSMLDFKRIWVHVIWDILKEFIKIVWLFVRKCLAKKVGFSLRHSFFKFISGILIVYMITWYFYLFYVQKLTWCSQSMNSLIYVCSIKIFSCFLWVLYHSSDHTSSDYCHPKKFSVLPPDRSSFAFLNSNMGGLFRSSFWGGGEGGKISPPPALKRVSIMLETSNLACKYTRICRFRKYTF